MVESSGLAKIRVVYQGRQKRERKREKEKKLILSLSGAIGFDI